MTIAVRVYLLPLLSYSIFTTKTSNRAEAKWLLLLADLETSGQWAWGVGALVHLYSELRYSSIASTKSLSGYPALLQAWILWYFPTVWRRRRGVAGEPLGGHWVKVKTDESLATYRKRIDGLREQDVCWRPFVGHQNARPYETMSLYRGWLRWGDITVSYMPDRCLRQFGYVQPIPRPPLRALYQCWGDIIRSIADHSVGVAQLVSHAQIAQYPHQVEPGYIQWLWDHSVCRLMGDEEPPQTAADDQEEAPPAQAAAHVADRHESPPRDGADVPDHHPVWVHSVVRLVREALRDGTIPAGSHYGRELYSQLGFPPYPPPPDHAGPGRGPGRYRRRE